MFAYLLELLFVWGWRPWLGLSSGHNVPQPVSIPTFYILSINIWKILFNYLFTKINENDFSPKHNSWSFVKYYFMKFNNMLYDAAWAILAGSERHALTTCMYCFFVNLHNCGVLTNVTACWHLSSVLKSPVLSHLASPSAPCLLTVTVWGTGGCYYSVNAAWQDWCVWNLCILCHSPFIWL